MPKGRRRKGEGRKKGKEEEMGEKERLSADAGAGGPASAKQEVIREGANLRRQLKVNRDGQRCKGRDGRRRFKEEEEEDGGEMKRVERFGLRVLNDLRNSIGNQTDFSLRIAKHILLKGSDGLKNVVFSPLSIHILLSLTAAGSNGRTQEQMVSFLQSKSPSDLNALSSHLVTRIFSDSTESGGPRLSLANGIWVDKAYLLKTSFKNTASTYYRAQAKVVDFQTQALQVANEVNSWAEQETNGLIKDLLPPGLVDSTFTRLILANALYFKGDWDEKFNSLLTRDLKFYLTDGSSVKVPFMTSWGYRFISAFDGFKVLGLPYKRSEDGGCFSMYFFLPDEKNGLQNLVEKLCSESGFINQHLPCKVVTGEFRIPKFKVSFGLEASAVLKELGLVLPFMVDADLTEMVYSPPGQNLYISSILHKTFIEVNEAGTEAGAVLLALYGGGCRPFTEDFIADHPFVFLIREDITGVVLFIGHVLNPLIAG